MCISVRSSGCGMGGHPRKKSHMNKDINSSKEFQSVYEGTVYSFMTLKTKIGTGSGGMMKGIHLKVPDYGKLCHGNDS